MKIKFFIIVVVLLLAACDSNTDTGEDGFKDYYLLDEELQHIGKILEEQDIVILGESTHWSIDIAEGKINLIDYLAEAHGFNKLFLETPDSEFNYYKDTGLDMKDGVAEQYHQDIFSEYLNGTDSNIRALPMDWSPVFQNNNASHISILEENITNEINEYDTGLAEEFKKSEYSLRDWFAKGLFLNQRVGNFERKMDVYEEIRSKDFFSELPIPTQDYIVSRHENIKSYYSQINFDNALIEYYDYREIGMANKVLSQMEQGDKVIVWVANGHSNYDVTKIDNTHEVFEVQRKNERNESLGALLRDSDYSVYNVGLDYNEAESLGLLSQEVSTPRKTGDETLAGYIGDRVSDDIFIDFETSDFIEDRVYTVFNAGTYDYQIVPQEQYDGLIYLDYLLE
ncbi:MAG TPA: hypothetical protein DEB42_08255 [Jeotgalicoccus sp.]|nr:hypothetical protein [Jeotgalicoccus sp.]